MTEAVARSSLAAARRVVVKVGSQLLAAEPSTFARVAADIAALVTAGRQVVLVTSGAIALGLEPLGLTERPRDLVGLQAAAAAGQSRLMRRWMDVCEGVHGMRCAQVLLTHADLADRRRYLNARSALGRLLGAGLLPIINENDTVSVEEIKLGDNDLLAAEVCGLIGAAAVALLTSSDGLMSGDPKSDPTAARIPFVTDVNTANGLIGIPSRFGTGGMGTKLRAAELARRHGAVTVIVPGSRAGVLAAAMAGDDVGTVFSPPSESPARARKRWIAHTLRPAGTLIVDEGAKAALEQHASLLYAGVREVRGRFYEGDCVEVALSDGAPFARGLVALDHERAAKVAGLKTAAARERLGELLPNELVHKDDLVML
ncbi:MAG: glutamate 5-kinase [Myxococcota bacterium]